MTHRLTIFLLTALSLRAADVDWAKINEETLRHYTKLIQLDTSGPPDFESKAVAYIKKVLEADGIEAQVFAQDPKRPTPDLPAFVEQLKKVANEPGVELVLPNRVMRPNAPASRIDTEMFRAIETTQKLVIPALSPFQPWPQAARTK